MTILPAQPQDLTCNLEVGIQAWFPLKKKPDSVRAGRPGETEVLPQMNPLVPLKANSHSAPHSDVCNEHSDVCNEHA